MNKKDLIPVVLLVLMIPLWIFIDKAFIAPKYPSKAPVQQPVNKAPAQEITPQTQALPTPIESAVEIPEVAEPKDQEIVAILANKKIKLEFTSLGGGIKSATMLDYPKIKGGDDPVVLDFSEAPALAYEGIPGIGAEKALNMQMGKDGQSIIFTKALESAGLVFERTISLGEGYLLKINDRFVATSTTPSTLPDNRILTGTMRNPAELKAMRGVSILGVDSFATTGVNYWGRKLHKLYGKPKPQPVSIDMVPETMNNVGVEWVSAKNKFFTQVLRPTEPIATMAILSSRETEGKGVVPRTVAAALVFKSKTLEAGSSHEMEYSYFIGPKKYSTLKEAGFSMEKVMEFETTGAFSFMNWLMEPARKALLWTMNMFHAMIPNYGIAIILLTLLVRILFWPLTHKSTESMKRMQEIQPEIKALQAKYKETPQKLQQETMKLYKEKKVNPMGGCLPMLVQIPVFIALFTVLRNAIELRYAGFLWIADLSTSENLFAGQIPFIGSLNILPLLMSASMIWQQKLTPQAATTPEQIQQQKMMMFMMPIMMLFFFYKMPSGLVLYWTTSNLLMIAQTSLRNLKKKKTEA